MKCMYAQTRPRFILSSEGVFGGMEFEPMLTPREKSPLPKKSPEEDRTRDAVDSEPKHYQLSYSGPVLLDNLMKKHPTEKRKELEITAHLREPNRHSENCNQVFDHYSERRTFRKITYPNEYPTDISMKF